MRLPVVEWRPVALLGELVGGGAEGAEPRVILTHPRVDHFSREQQIRITLAKPRHVVKLRQRLLHRLGGSVRGA